MTKRIASLLFCLLFVMSTLLLAGCGSEEEAAVSVSVDDESFAAILGEDAKTDWEGKEVTFLCRNGGETSYITYQVDAEEANDDPLINAFYRRNAYIKQTYGLDINVAYPESGEDIIDMFRMDIMSSSGDPNYYGIVHPISALATLASDGLLKDFNSVGDDYIHLEEDYWDQAIIRDVKIKGKVFFINGDAIVQDDQATWCMYFNRKVIDEYKLDNPYDLVKNNEWNFDKMYEMAQEYDLTNGAVKSYKPEDKDKWGLVVQSYDFYQFMMGADQRMVDNTTEVPTLRIDDPLNYDTFSKIASWFIFDNQNVGVADYHGPWNGGVYDDEVKIFANGNALFMPHNLSTAGSTDIRESELEFGILPMPKRDASQENYVSGVNAYHCDVIALPHNLEDENLDAACFALEAMAYYGKQLVTPEYYETTVCQKRLQDDESVEMLEIILSNRIYDMGSVLNFNNGNEYEGTLYFYTDLLGDHSDAIASHYEARKAAFQAGIDRLVAQCEETLG